MFSQVDSFVRTTAVLVVIALSLGGCALTKDLEAHKNRDRLGTLSLGMTQEQVLQIMGKPWKTEAFMKNERAHAVLYYVTQRIPDGATTDDEMTPVVFGDGILIGWGRRFFSDIRIELKTD